MAKKIFVSSLLMVCFFISGCTAYKIQNFSSSKLKNLSGGKDSISIRYFNSNNSFKKV